MITRRDFLKFGAATAGLFGTRLITGSEMSRALGATIAQRLGGTLVVAQGLEPPHINPTLSFQSLIFVPANQVYDRLVSMDYGGAVSPGLAERWDISEGGLTYTFHLARNIRWTDGRPFTPEDIKFTYEGILEQKLPGTEQLRDVKAIETPNNTTLVIRLKEVNAAFLAQLAMSGTWYTQILPKHLYQGTDWSKNPRNETPVGTGPFILEEWVKGSHISYKANTSYYRGRPFLDRVVVRFISDPRAVQEAFRAGEIQYTTEEFAPPMREVLDMQNDRRWRVDILQGFLWYNVVYLNLQKTPLNDVRVRRAIAHAVDQNEQNRRVLLGKGVIQRSPAVDFLPGNWVNPRATFPEHNLQEANRLLDAAGYPRKVDGTRFSIHYLTFAASLYEAIATVFKAQMARVGIHVIIDLVEYGTWLAKLGSGDFDTSLYFPTYGPDPDAWRGNVGTRGSLNYMKYSSPRVDKALESGARTIDPNQRRRFYYEVQEELVKDLPYIHTCPLPLVFIMNNDFRGFANERETWGKAGPWRGGFRLVQKVR